MTGTLRVCGYCESMRERDMVNASNAERAQRGESPLELPKKSTKTCLRLTASRARDGVPCRELRAYKTKAIKESGVKEEAPALQALGTGQ